MNKQIPTSYVENDGNFIQVHSIFSTIQGEGPYSGHRAIFIRLAGCNLQCPFCDTEYTQGSHKSTIGYTILEVSRRIIDRERKGHLVVVTGGEPFRQSNTALLLNSLVEEGFTVQVETNGSLDISGIRPDVCVVCSPKTGRVHASVPYRADAFKYVLEHTNVNLKDGLPVQVLGHSTGPSGVFRPPVNYKGKIYIQPMDPGNNDLEYKRNVNACIASCLSFGYTLQLQIHKILGVE